MNVKLCIVAIAWGVMIRVIIISIFDWVPPKWGEGCFITDNRHPWWFQWIGMMLGLIA